MRTLFARKFSGKVWDLDEMLKIFRCELEAKEQASLTVKAEKSYEKSRENYTTGALYSASKLSNYQASSRNPASGSRNNKSCLFCQGNHPLFRCTKVTDPKIRKDLIFKNRLCFICLDNSHIASKCTSNYTCKKCEGRHNISICTKDFKNDHQNSNGSQNSQDSQNQNLHQNDNQTTTTFANNVNNILLQTACADIVSIENGCSKKVHILFDSGAQRSYITKELQKSLNLKPLRVERIVLNVFGKEGGEIMNVDVVKLKVETVTDKIFMEALCIPTISARLSNQNSQYVLSQNYPHLQGLSIANSSSKTSFDVDLLVGLDFYSSFITGNVQRGDDDMRVDRSDITASAQK